MFKMIFQLPLYIGLPLTYLQNLTLRAASPNSFNPLPQNAPLSICKSSPKSIGSLIGEVSFVSLHHTPKLPHTTVAVNRRQRSHILSKICNRMKIIENHTSTTRIVHSTTQKYVYSYYNVKQMIHMAQLQVLLSVAQL